MAALVLALVCARPARATEVSVFYCYVPDVASGVVWQSQALPVGPLAERSRYGREFAQYLAATNKVSADLAGYCVMGANAADIARAQAALANEPCPECGGARRFEPVSWPRAGKVRSSAPAPQPAEASSRPSVTTMLVVMGNTETGKLLVVSNAPDTAAVAAQAKMLRATGWKSLLATREPGYGAAFCVRHAGEVRFFLAHAQASIKEAIAQARDFSAPYEAETGQPAKICGAPWRAQDGADSPREHDVIDGLQDAIRDEYACDRKSTGDDSKACPPRNMSGTGVRG